MTFTVEVTYQPEDAFQSIEVDEEGNLTTFTGWAALGHKLSRIMQDYEDKRRKNDSTGS